MNANGALRFRREACLFEWRHHPPRRAPRPRGDLRRTRPSRCAQLCARSRPPKESGVLVCVARDPFRVSLPGVLARASLMCVRFARASAAILTYPLDRSSGTLTSERDVVRRAVLERSLRPVWCRWHAAAARNCCFCVRVGTFDARVVVVGFRRLRARRLLTPPSNESRLPAELKHITKRRRRN